MSAQTEGSMGAGRVRGLELVEGADIVGVAGFSNDRKKRSNINYLKSKKAIFVFLAFFPNFTYY
jgi:hypothetical protein